jgi:hypothetical protein
MNGRQRSRATPFNDSGQRVLYGSKAWRQKVHRAGRADAALTALNEQRDHIAIKVSLAWDADPPDLIRLAALQRELEGVERRIHNYRPAEA